MEEPVFSGYAFNQDRVKGPTSPVTPYSIPKGLLSHAKPRAYVIAMAVNPNESAGTYLSQ